MKLTERLQLDRMVAKCTPIVSVQVAPTNYGTARAAVSKP